MDKEIKQESSIPVQSRVSMVTLAELDLYWTGDGYNIKTMSQLLSWSVELLREVLAAYCKLPIVLDSVAKADRHLQSRGLYQAGMKKRGFKKRATALTFESLRGEGVDPKHYVPQQYNVVHNKNSVEQFEGSGECIVVDPAQEERINKLTEQALKIYEEQNNKIV